MKELPLFNREGAVSPAVSQRYLDMGLKMQGETTYALCSICGYAEFVSGDTEKKASLQFVWRNAAACSKCEEVARRAPEVFTWMLNTLQVDHDAKATI
jgi:hypothetical protein